MTVIITAAEVYGEDPDHAVTAISRVGGGLYKVVCLNGRPDPRVLRDPEDPDELPGPSTAFDPNRPDTLYKVFESYEDALAVARAVASG